MDEADAKAIYVGSLQGINERAHRQWWSVFLLSFVLIAGVVMGACLMVFGTGSSSLMTFLEVIGCVVLTSLLSIIPASLLRGERFVKRLKDEAYRTYQRNLQS